MARQLIKLCKKCVNGFCHFCGGTIDKFTKEGAKFLFKGTSHWTCLECWDKKETEGKTE